VQPSMLPPAAGLLTGGSNPGGGADKQVGAVCWLTGGSTEQHEQTLGFAYIALDCATCLTLQGANQQWMEYVNELSKLTEDKASPTSERRLTQIVSQAVRAYLGSWTRVCPCCKQCAECLVVMERSSRLNPYPSRHGLQRSSCAMRRRS
jgi:hypothetical protein